MPPSDAQKAIEAMARQVASMDAAVAARLIDEYGAVYQRLQRDIDRLLTHATRQKLKPWQVMRLDRYRQLEAQLLQNVTKFSQIAGAAVTEGQRAAVGLSARGVPTVVNASLPTGISLDTLASIGLEWNRLPEEAFNAFVGISGSGQPVGNLLAPLGPEVADEVKATIRTGIAMGTGPKQVAAEVRKVAGMPLSKALTISRTEILRSYREATRLNYAANSNIVKGYRRLANKDENTCLACIALDGTVYENEEPLDSHPNCRCNMLPETLTYEDLGLDVPEIERPPQGKQWFDQQPESAQRKMMGPKKYEAYKRGQIDLSDVVKTSTSSVWGKSSTVISDRALGL